MAVRSTADGRRRSVAWVYYAIITLALIFAGFTVPIGFAAALVTGAYACYLFQGGRFVLWIW